MRATSIVRTLMRPNASKLVRNIGANNSRNWKVLPALKARSDLFCTVAAEKPKEEVKEEPAPTGGVGARVLLTCEVAVSKIFPAGFCWQGASVIAGNMGHEADTIPFALMTGLGDGFGVVTGHTMYYAIKKATVDPSINLKAQFQTGILLGTAAFHAGTMWQPIVNFLHDTAHLSFNEVVAGTVAGCGFFFYLGLRVGRTLYNGILSDVEGPTYKNLKNDAALSLSIGGATGCFVGTDVSFCVDGVEQNWLRPVVGVEDTASDISGMISAGTSTVMGFTSFQMVQNVVVPQGKAWVD